MAKSIHRVSVTLKRIESLAPDIKLLTLADPDDWDLPPFEPGAHIDVHLPSGITRQYSLCSDAADRRIYQIAVKHETEGRGGSSEIHHLQAGTDLLVSLPRNLLPLVNAKEVVIIAGGIGITPFVPMLTEMNRTGQDYRLHYATRHTAVPFAEALGAQHIDRVSVYKGAEGPRLNVEKIISALSNDAHLYCCGPNRMIDEVIAKTEHIKDRVHIEYFGGSIDPSQKSYDIHLAKTQQTIGVQEGQTMLEALRAADIEVPASCEGGICLECKTRYLKGDPEHRDITMPKADRDRFLTPCVSGCVGKEITLDL